MQLQNEVVKGVGRVDEVIKTFTLRLTEEQHKILEDEARKQNLSKNQFIIKLIMKSKRNSDFKETTKEQLLFLIEQVALLSEQINEQKNNKKIE